MRNRANAFLIEWALLLGALLLLAGAIGCSLYDEHQGIDQRERERLATQARVIHDNLSRQLDAINRALLSVRESLPEWKGQPDGMAVASRHLKAFADAMPSVRTMLILGAEGSILAASRPDILPTDNFRERAYFQVALKNPDPNTFYISPPFKTSLGAWGINVVRMVPGPQGEFSGIVSATLDPDEFKFLLESVRYAPDMRASLVHGNGDIFLLAPPVEGTLGKNLAQPGTLFSRHSESGQSATVMTGLIAATGDRRMIAQQNLQPAALAMNDAINIAVSRDLDALYANWQREARFRGGLVALLMALSISSLYLTQRRRQLLEAKALAVEAALQGKSRELERFFSVSLDLMCIAEMEGRFLKLNPAWEKTLGYRLADLEGQYFMSFVHPDDREATLAAVVSLGNGEAITQFSNRYRTKEGDYRHIEWHATPYDQRLIYAAARDVTEQKRNEQNLADSEHFMRSLIDIIPGMVGYWDSELRNRFANSAYLDWFGKTPEQMRGIRIQDMMGEELFTRNEPFIRAALAGERQRFERTLTKADGSTGYTWAHYIPDCVGGQVRGFFVLVSDITELKRAQLQLEAVNTALQARTTESEAANLAKSAFLANMSHEIRTPMNAVLGLLQLLQHTSLDARQLDYAKKAQGAAQSLLAILNDILDFSKVEAGKMTLDNAPFRLDELLRNLSVLLSSALHNKAVEVLFQLDPGVPSAMRGDGLRLQQVLLNLAGNAIKFTEQGEVIIALRLLDSGPESIRIEFSVHDTGIGIPADRLAAVFEGFTQAETSTTRRYGGTGLGLAISQRLVNLMGGELAAESTLGQGSHFHFTLDFGRDAETRASEQRETRDASAAGTADTPGALRVLITDDNATARDILADMARSFGWQIATADSGMAAIERLRQEAAAGRPFDILCVDWLMPGMDGWETIQHIRAAQGAGHPPAILMITAHGRDLLSERLGGQASPLDGFLVKPVTPSMLFDAVAQATHGASVSAKRRLPAADTRSRPLAGLRILVVEDNPLNQQVAQELLSHAGAWVQVANDGRQGIASFRTTQPPFDAVLMDIQMPEMDGYEATHILRTELGTRLPIIAMTANARPEDRETCLAAGMDDHIGKPIDIGEVIATLLRHCRGEIVAAATPAATADAPLPALPDGFDLAAALVRIDGNRRLFATLARRFGHDREAIVLRAEQALRQGDRAGAARELHTLKGLAATLGAMELANLAADSEARVKASSERTEDDHLLDGVRETLARVTATLRSVADNFDPPNPMPEALADPARLRDLLAELDSLLAENNMRALDVYGTLKREAGNILGDGLAALDEAIARLNFSNAREKVANLLTLINHAPD